MLNNPKCFSPLFFLVPFFSFLVSQPMGENTTGEGEQVKNEEKDETEGEKGEECKAGLCFQLSHIINMYV